MTKGALKRDGRCCRQRSLRVAAKRGRVARTGA
jgi:hypothetical protein